MGISRNIVGDVYPTNALSVNNVHNESIQNSKTLAQPFLHSRVLDHKRHRAYFNRKPYTLKVSER